MPSFLPFFLSALFQKNENFSAIQHQFINVESNNVVDFMVHQSEMHVSNSSYSAIQVTPKTQATEKRFKCAYCGRTFKQKAHLMKHILIHTGEKPFMCAICNTSFRQKEHLKNHHLVHMKKNLMNLSEYRCNQCGLNFKTEYFLERHLTNVHSKEAWVSVRK